MSKRKNNNSALLVLGAAALAFVLFRKKSANIGALSAKDRHRIFAAQKAYDDDTYKYKYRFRKMPAYSELELTDIDEADYQALADEVNRKRKEREERFFVDPILTRKAVYDSSRRVFPDRKITAEDVKTMFQVLKQNNTFK